MTVGPAPEVHTSGVEPSESEQSQRPGPDLCFLLALLLLAPLCAGAILREAPQPQSFSAATVHGTNDLWLEITGRTNCGAAMTLRFTIHPPQTNQSGAYSLFMSTNLPLPFNWLWLTRNNPGQTNLVISNLPPRLSFFRLGPPTAIRPGFNQQSLPPNDDDSAQVIGWPGSDPITNLVPVIGFAINFYGVNQTNLFVNNNGNVTFGAYLSDYTPRSLQEAAAASSVGIIAPFWGDVDTRGVGSGLAYYGTNTVDGRLAFGVTWDHVGYYAQQTDKLNTFQLVLVDRSNRSCGDYDIEFNYSQVQWEAGQASGGIKGLGGSPPRAGFACSTNEYELPGSGITGSFLDTNPTNGLVNPTGLIYSNFNSTVPGRYVFQFHQGMPLAVPTNSTPTNSFRLAP